MVASPARAAVLLLLASDCFQTVPPSFFGVVKAYPTGAMIQVKGRPVGPGTTDSIVRGQDNCSLNLKPPTPAFLATSCTIPIDWVALSLEGVLNSKLRFQEAPGSVRGTSRRGLISRVSGNFTVGWRHRRRQARGAFHRCTLTPLGCRISATRGEPRTGARNGNGPWQVLGGCTGSVICALQLALAVMQALSERPDSGPHPGGVRDLRMALTRCVWRPSACGICFVALAVAACWARFLHISRCRCFIKHFAQWLKRRSP